ncbi:MAG: gamma-glutamylcyclotransferase family protein [Filomicrobium sp.]
MPVRTPDNRICHLFVYGSLMSQIQTPMGTHQRMRLAGESRSLGPASASGRLVSLGQYPGLIDGASNADIVQGELLLLHNPQTTLLWLDRYENVQHGGDGEYRRELKTVELNLTKVPKFAERSADAKQQEPVASDGTNSGLRETTPPNRTYKAWIYIYQGPMTSARPVPSGNWLTR